MRDDTFNEIVPESTPENIEPPKPAWRGLTSAEVKVLWNQTRKPTEFAVMLESKLRERNHESRHQ
jgi:hypothetical protein